MDQTERLTDGRTDRWKDKPTDRRAKWKG